jgi:glucokinase
MTNTSVIVGDIGGTNARFAVFAPQTGTLSSIRILQCADYVDFLTMLDVYLAGCDDNIKMHRLSLAVAGPVDDDHISLSNNDISFSKRCLISQYQLTELTVVNDFTAQAMAVPYLDPAHLKTLRSGIAYDNTPILVLGPGTGMGFSTLVPTATGWRPLETEGGNIGLSPQSADEDLLVSWLRNHTDYVASETVLSGRGIEYLYAYCAEQDAKDPRFTTAAEIGDAALAGDRLAEKAICQFFDILGSYIADGILATGSRHAVYLSGGIVPKLLKLLPKSQFLARVGIRGIYSDYINSVPIYLVMDPYAGLSGAGYSAISQEFSHRTIIPETP